MTAEYVSRSAGGQVSGDTVTPGAPPNVEDGDLLVGITAGYADWGIPSLPTNWNNIVSGGYSQISIRTFWQVAPIAMPSCYGPWFSVPGIVAIRGADTSDPIAASAIGQNAVSLVTTEPNQLVLVLHGIEDVTVTGINSYGNLEASPRGDFGHWSFSYTGGDGSIGGGYGVMASPGSTGNITAVLNGHQTAMAAMAIKGAVVGGSRLTPSLVGARGAGQIVAKQPLIKPY